MASLDVDGGDGQIIAERDFKVVSFLNLGKCSFELISHIAYLDAPYLKESAKNSGEVKLLTKCFRKPKGTIKAEVQVAELGVLPGEYSTKL